MKKTSMRDAFPRNQSKLEDFGKVLPPDNSGLPDYWEKNDDSSLHEVYIKNQAQKMSSKLDECKSKRYIT